MPPQTPPPVAEKAQKPAAKDALGSLVQEALDNTTRELATTVKMHEQQILQLTTRAASLERLQRQLTPELSDALYTLVQSGDGYNLVVRFIEAARAARKE